MTQVKSTNHSPACQEVPLPHCLPTCPMIPKAMRSTEFTEKDHLINSARIEAVLWKKRAGSNQRYIYFFAILSALGWTWSVVDNIWGF